MEDNKYYRKCTAEYVIAKPDIPPRERLCLTAGHFPPFLSRFSAVSLFVASSLPVRYSIHSATAHRANNSHSFLEADPRMHVHST